MNKMEILIIISALLLPVNLYCSFWIFREVLNLSGITFREMLKDLNGLAIPSGRFGKGMRRRQRILLNYLLKRSYEPEKTQMLFRRYKHSITPGVIAVILTDYIAFSKNTNKISVAIVGIAVLLIFNIALALYGKIYKKNHPLDNEILAIVERKKKNTYGIGIVGSIVAIIIALIMYIGCFLLVAAVAQVPSRGGQQSSNQPKDVQQLSNTEEDYNTGDRLDESRVIAEQCFNVDLNDWGKVRFVSYRPTYDTLWEDVSFVLAKDNQIVYYFPACFENNSTENDSIGMFDSVEAVGFQDIDGDNAKDVIVIINYVTGVGPQGMLPRKSVRIFKACDNGFIILEDLMIEIMENIDESELSVPTICEYIEADVSMIRK